jgi:two-component system response regulator ArlR
VQRILIVEDEELISLFLREELSDVGFHVDVRAEGAAGMSLCRERRYSAAIVDVGLPDMSGVDVARRCREIDTQLPIVLATGSNTREISELFAQDACVQVLEKPYETTALLNCLTTLGVTSGYTQ